MVLTGNDIKLRDLGFSIEYRDPSGDGYEKAFVTHGEQRFGILALTILKPEDMTLSVAVKALYEANNSEFRDYVNAHVPGAVDYLG